MPSALAETRIEIEIWHGKKFEARTSRASYPGQITRFAAVVRIFASFSFWKLRLGYVPALRPLADSESELLCMTKQLQIMLHRLFVISTLPRRSTYY